MLISKVIFLSPSITIRIFQGPSCWLTGGNWKCEVAIFNAYSYYIILIGSTSICLLFCWTSWVDDPTWFRKFQCWWHFTTVSSLKVCNSPIFWLKWLAQDVSDRSFSVNVLIALPSGRLASLSVDPLSTVKELKLLAQKSFQKGFLTLVTKDGRSLERW